MLVCGFAFLLLLIPIATIGQNTNKDTEKILTEFNAYDYTNKSLRTSIKIEPGDSFYTLELLEKQRIAEEQIQRDLITRQGRTESYTGHGIATRLYRDNTNNCVAWAMRATGITEPIGNGGRSRIQGAIPKVGAIGVEKGISHAVVIVAINGRIATIHESNYEKGWITERQLDISNFLGYIYS